MKTILHVRILDMCIITLTPFWTSMRVGFLKCLVSPYLMWFKIYPFFNLTEESDLHLNVP